MTGAVIRLGLVLYRDISAHTLGSLVRLSNCIEGGVVWDYEIGADVAQGRNKIVERCREGGEPNLLFIDGDMAFSPEDVNALAEALTEHPEMGAVSAFYIKWDGSALPVLGWRDKRGWMPPEKLKAKAAGLTGCHPVQSFGGGLLLINPKVFDKVPFPWFEAHYDDFGYCGNDTSFCLALQKAGYRPSVHFDVKVTHVGPTAWDAAQFYPSAKKEAVS